MERRKVVIELAGLLDGELDGGRAEQLYTRINEDAELRCEFELQREVKTALSQLPEFDPPDFLTTRVLGEIANRRADHKVSRWRTVTVALGGFTFCLMLVTGMLLFNNPTWTRPGAGEALLAGKSTEARPVLPLDGGMLEYTGWRELEMPVNAGEDAADFLQFVNEQHSYSRLVNSSSSMTPDLPGALLVLDGKLYVMDRGGN